MPQTEVACSPRLLQALVHKVHRHLGIDFSGARGQELLRRLQLLAIDQQASDLNSWLKTLAFADWDAPLLQSLVPAFSVGETYFRRDAEALDWLAQQHFARLLASRRQAGQRSLRLWSAGCCTGEEAYSLLFLLDELLGTERERWTVELVASDISAEFLARAEQGLYGSNAFRRNEVAFRNRYFQAEGRMWRVRDAWRGRIRFVQYNFMDDLQSCLLANADLILCRNVLMYFSQARASAVLTRLLGCLNADGVLLLSAVEAGIATQAGLGGSWAGCNYALTRQALTQKKTTPPQVGSPLPYGPEARTTLPPVVRPLRQTEPRPQVSAQAPISQPAPPAPESHWQQAQQALSSGRYDDARQALLAYLACAGPSRAEQHQACLLLARSWADQQHLDQAQDWLQRALQLQPDSAHAYCLQAQLAQHSADPESALKALHKALYLDPELILAYFLQAGLLAAQGQSQASSKALNSCLKLLHKQDKDALVPLADGMSCMQLLRLCEQLQESAKTCPSH